jgi:AcrR family transcriptional regulator
VARPAAAEREPYDAQALAEIAMTVFAERGYEGSSLEDIARAAGIAKSSIYHHVPSKEELLSLGLQRGFHGLFKVVDETMARDEPALARLRYLVSRCVEGAIVDRAGVMVLLTLKGSTETEVWARAELERFQLALQGLVRKAIRDGDLRDTVDPADAVRLLMGMVTSLTTWFAVEDLDLDRLQRAIDTIAFEGVTTTSGRRRRSRNRSSMVTNLR